ncbi:hypothetical protein [Tolypothrix bouteillei]|uniref:hypothetical protein n=1 Tax=Tolypothrix bouteillei TaxID=1246981 RepID=UPI0038B68FF8
MMIFAGGIPLQCHNSTLGLIGISCVRHHPQEEGRYLLLSNFLVNIANRHDSLQLERILVKTTYSDLDCQAETVRSRSLEAFSDGMVVITLSLLIVEI